MHWDGAPVPKPTRREKTPRSPMRSKPQSDPVTDALHNAVLRRDGACFVSTIDPLHECMDAFDHKHAPDDLAKLTVDHVHPDGGQAGKRAPSTERTMVAMCAKMNIAGPSREVREAERAYLKSLDNA